MLISSGLPLAARDETIGASAKPAPAAAVERRKPRLFSSLVVFRFFIVLLLAPKI
jgi:hypothetical protein